MKIEGTPEEFAALVVAIQERHSGGVDVELFAREVLNRLQAAQTEACK